MTMLASGLRPAPLANSPLPLLPMAQGGSWYAKDVSDADLLSTLEAAYRSGIRHFDTAAGYGNGRSETLLGRFLEGKRESVFLASKSHTDDLTAAASLAEVEGSLRRLAVEFIDLYYIHWPRAGRDMRPVMEGLEAARAQGKIGAVGVSNFSVAQMEQVSEVGRIDVHQLGYNLLWRYAEAAGNSILPKARYRGGGVQRTRPRHSDRKVRSRSRALSRGISATPSCRSGQISGRTCMPASSR